ncbi:MAG: hypothetical protein R2799_05045 [Crocinitomicaceae bacterium]
MKKFALGDSTWNPATTAITQNQKRRIDWSKWISGVGNVALESIIRQNGVVQLNSQEDQLVVFSEVFYPKY